MTTPNKGYPTLATGAGVDSWGETYNDEGWTVVDSNLGGITTKGLTNVNVTLTAEESQDAILRLTGVLTGNVIITTSCIGFVFVENATTGSFNVTLRNNLIATAAQIPQGGRVIVTSDATNGCRVSATGDFPSGTRLPFQQTVAPTGWTKESDSAYTNSALRLNTGSVTTGGTMTFSSTFTDRTILANMMPNISISISDPGHVHPYIRYTDLMETNLVSGLNQVMRNPGTLNTTSATTGITASINNASRGGVAQQPFSFDVKYVDFCVAQKN